ncbi:nucleotidyltransferase domain-containing protein [Nocardiopsis sp. HUAS JQ3]|uniref:nucleotidyltransferase domain-containing protein n=1 Tax=Nocardiopsis sp. HUAS JQ3 TaxID=3061629 RepID=UPI0023A963FE|nr:nucleotidyltransferase domain-containing protein [Nocardiopsis sp. HUAS JQ3]WDZ88846.1 nucleotidyltransferase domain-containing protein [Nocardiopsis sp. HUAS JQ3]
MEFTSFSTESCAPAGDGGIVPGLVPIPNVDPDELDEAVGRLRAVGEAIEESGEGITSTWASLTGVYVAPEADTLLSALDPVSSDGSAVATGVRDAASALETFAETARELKSRLTGLKAEAEAFRADVGWDREWLEDEDERERNNDLNNRVAAAVHEYQEAERACANAIGQHYGGTFFTGHSDKAGHDQTSTGGDRTWQVYGTASAPVDQANPWGSAVDEPPGALENVFWSVGDIAIGMAVGLGVTTGLYRDGQFVYPFGTEHGQNLLTNWEEAKNSFWALAGSDGQGEWIAPESLDAQYHNAKEAWQAYGDAIVPVSEWDHRPEYTIVNGAGNIALMASPLGWGRVFLDGPDLGSGSGSGSGPDGNGSPDGGRGTHSVDGTGNGLRGTDTVGMATSAPTGGQSDPGNAIGGMHESLSGLESQSSGSPASEGTPSGSPTPAPSPEAPTGPSGNTPSPDVGGTALNGGGTSAGSEAVAPRDTDDPTAQDLRDGTSDSGSDTSSAPWATSPVDDGSASGQESPTAPVSGPARGDGFTVDDSGATDSANSGSDHSEDGQNGQGLQENDTSNDHGQDGTGEDQGSLTPDGGDSGSGDEPPRDGTITSGNDDGESSKDYHEGPPQGISQEDFEKGAELIRETVGDRTDDIVVQGSRAAGTARPDSDIDFAVRINEETFHRIIEERFKQPNPGSSKERTMLHAIKVGKIQSGEAGFKPLRLQLQEIFKMKVDISFILKKGPFDNPPFIEVP